MNLYHGTSKKSMDVLVKEGFSYREYGSYFTNNKETAELYAKNRTQYDISEPYVLCVDTTGWNIVDFSDVGYKDFSAWIDVMLTGRRREIDAVLTDKDAGFYMVLNFDKLNEQIKRLEYEKTT